MPAHHNGALDPHQQTPTSLPHFLLRTWLLIIQPYSTRIQLLPRRLNTTRMKSKAKFETLRRLVICASYMHRAYFPFAHLNAVITGMMFMKLAPPQLWFDLPLWNPLHPWIPSQQPSYHPLSLLVLSVPKGNSSTTKVPGLARSIRRERSLTFREFPILLWCISSTDIGCM
jgi:hypothetical protein